MCDTEKVLTICLPTYNRALYLKKQLDFFVSEVEQFPDLLKKVNFIIADNSSEDNSASIIEEYNKKYKYFDYVVNEKNIGLIGNLNKLTHLANDEYIWFVGDDDELKNGIVMKVLNTLELYPDLNYILLNYNLLGAKAHSENLGYYKNSKNRALDIFKEMYGSLVFITSSVYKRKNIVSLKNHELSKKISAPMLYSFYSCSKGSIFITKDIWVYFNMGNASYKGLKNELKLKFEHYLPILISLEDFGYQKKLINNTIQSYLSSQSIAFFLYALVNFKNFRRMYKYVNHSLLSSIPVNLYSISKNLIYKSKN